MVVFAQVAGAPKTVADVVHDMFDRFRSGKAINEQELMGAAAQVFGSWAMGGGIAGGYHPPVNPGQTEGQAHRATRTINDDIRDAWEQTRAWRDPRPAAPDPVLEQLRRARQVMGFAESEVLDEVKIRDRKRVLAKKHHPDRGGSAAKMAEINDAADTLMATL